MSIQRFLSRYINQLYALMRIVVGFLFMCHGIQKGIRIVNGLHDGDILFYLAAVIESLAGLLILHGL